MRYAIAMSPGFDHASRAASPIAKPSAVIIEPPNNICTAVNDSTSSFEWTLRM